MATSLVDLIPRDSGSRYQQSNTPAQPNPATSGIHSSELGRNVYNAAMALPGIGGVARLASTGGMISRAFNAAAGAANTASRGTAALATVPNAVPEAKAQTINGAQPGQQQLGPSPSAPAGTPQTQSLVNAEEMQRRQATQSTGQQVPGLSGVYKHGYGQYSDNPNGMGLPQNLGQPSAQNMAAADALAGQQHKRSLIDAMYAQQEPAARGFPGFAAPEISHSGNDWSTRNELRSLRMAAERAMENAPRKRFAAQHPAVQAYQAALQADMAARTGGQAALQAKTNDTNASLVREQMQQEGANQRERPRTMMDAMRLEMERKNQELVNRPRAMIAALQEQIAAEQDAARRNGLVQLMRDIEGRNTEVDPYLVVPGGQQINEHGQAYTAPSTVFNRRTGQWLMQPGAQPAQQSKYQVGTVSRVGNKEAVWDGTKWVPR